MFQGFYNVASGMFTQSRNLNVISNNMANVSTPGYKKDTMTSTTFQQEMFYRTGNQSKGGGTQLGNVNMIRVPQQTVTNFSMGNYNATESQLDFAITSEGFFKIATADDEVAYTRNGSFYVDEEGALALKGVGRVQGEGGDIYLESDNILADSAGGIYNQEGELIDNLDIVDFEDYTSLVKGSNGVFTTNAEELETETTSVMNQSLELSNSDTIKDMQDMITAQRSFQSASQILKIYDQMMSRATTEIGRL